MDMGYLLSFLAGMCIAIVICDIISHKFFKRKRNKVYFYIARNKVHFYVARDKSSDRLWLYLNMTTRNKITPATKEQRDTFMKVMNDDGYKWDATRLNIY